MRSACILLALFWFLVISRMGFSQSDPNNPNETGMHPYETYDGASGWFRRRSKASDKSVRPTQVLPTHATLAAHRGEVIPTT